VRPLHKQTQLARRAAERLASIVYVEQLGDLQARVASGDVAPHPQGTERFGERSERVRPERPWPYHRCPLPDLASRRPCLPVQITAGDVLGRELINGLSPTRARMSVPGPKAAFGRVPCQVAKVPNPDMVDVGRGKEKAARRRLFQFEMRESGEAMLRPILLPAISSCSEARSRGSGVKLPAARRQSATPAR
jgi:hypothetical protein